MPETTNYRLTGTGGIDKKSARKGPLILDASRRHGCFVLWAWNGKQWCREETFVF